MNSETANLLWRVYTPLIWGLVVLCVILGLIGVFAPQRLRGWVSILVRNRPVRIFGAVNMIIGGLIFPNADQTQLPVAMQIVSVLFFISGGVMLIIPTMAVIITERLVERGAAFYRILGLVHFGLAYFFYLASKAAQPITEIVEDVVEQNGGAPPPGV